MFRIDSPLRSPDGSKIAFGSQVGDAWELAVDACVTLALTDRREIGTRLDPRRQADRIDGCCG
jgi:hypothetical protein